MGNGSRSSGGTMGSDCEGIEVVMHLYGPWEWFAGSQSVMEGLGSVPGLDLPLRNA